MKIMLLTALFVIASGTQAEEPRSPEQTLIEMGIQYRTIWRGLHNFNDYFASNHFGEVRRYPPVQQLYYIPDQLPDGQGKTLYRFYDPHRVQHTESLETQLGGSNLEGNLGTGWTRNNKPRGTEQVFRLQTLDGHCALSNSLVNPDAACEKLPFPELFAYPRPSASGKRLECIDGLEVRLCSNKIAGGAISELVWNQRNFVAGTGYTHYIQSSLRFPGGAATPSEGGSNFNAMESDLNAWNGAPLLHINTDRQNKKQNSSAIAIDQDFRSFARFAPHSPPKHASHISGTLYPELNIGKEVHLDPFYLSLGDDFDAYVPQIVVYEAIINTPEALGSETEPVTVHIPGGSVNSYQTFGNRYFTIDAEMPDQRSGVTELFDSDFQNHGDVEDFDYQMPVAGAGGVAIASDDLQYAIGVYGRHEQAGFNGKFSGYLTEQARSGHWALRFTGELNKGENRFRAYIVLGTLDDIYRIMKRLQEAGY